MKKSYLPLTIQNADFNSKSQGDDKGFNYFIEIKKLQTSKVIPYGFHRPISKIY